MTPKERAIKLAVAARQAKMGQRRESIVEFARSSAFDGITRKDIRTILLDPEAPWNDGQKMPDHNTIVRDLDALVQQGLLRVQGNVYFPCNLPDDFYPGWMNAEIEAFQRGEPDALAKMARLHADTTLRLARREENEPLQ